MRRGFVLVAILFLVGASTALGYMSGAPTATLTDSRGELLNDLPQPSMNGTRQDTVYFGGDDGSGYAYLGGVWDWDTIVSDPLQGWTTRDMTADVATYFYRVNADSFVAHGDGCTPMMGFGSWQLWCGVHEDDANMRDFISGMGYSNNSCQRAMSPIYSISSGNEVHVGFRYFNDTEVGFDYTYAYVNCYDINGDLIQDGGQFEAAKLDGIDGAYDAPSTWSSTHQYAELPAGTASVQLELNFVSDGGWSDEDGSWATECGPFAADNIDFNIGTSNHYYDFEASAQGWTFTKCDGVGAFMAVWPQSEWSLWLEQAGVGCACPMSNNVLGFVTDIDEDLPGFPVLHQEQAYSGILVRGPYQPPDYNAVYVKMAGYAYLKYAAGTFARGGYSIYPYSTDVNPVPHWSPRAGQDVWHYTGEPGFCTEAAAIFDWDLTRPPDGDPIPANWEQMKFIFETITDCVSFQIPPSTCTLEGITYGSPLIDNVQIGLTWAPDAPPIAVDTGGLFHDGYGQMYPTYLEPGDVSNADISYDLSRDDFAKNDWHADSTSITGPKVLPASPRRWNGYLCVKVDQEGPRQAMIPGYLAWKNRLAFGGDVTEDYVCVMMDTVGTYKYRFASYFHESSPGFDPTHEDYSRYQEILPDSIWTPGTKLSYKYAAQWVDGAEPEYTGPWEMEILPGMRLQSGEPYNVEWPCVLFVDRFNRGTEYYIVPLLEQMGLEFDKYDALDGSSNYDCSIKRTFGGTYFNPGGWGNNGMTTQQMLGYRMILMNIGTFGLGSCEPGDWEILDLWLSETGCGLADTRRALIMDGDAIAQALSDGGDYGNPGFLNNVLGTTYVGIYRDYNNDDATCVYLEPASGAVFTPASPGVSLYGNGCPQQYGYNVLGLQAGPTNVVGNLRYWSYQGTGDAEYVNYAQVVRTKIQSQVANWKSVVDGFSFHHLSQRGYAGEDCSTDSTAVLLGASNLLGPMLTWLQAGGAPFVNWRYPCTDTAVEDDGETHVSGPVNYLYAARPNPFRGTATVRFSLATPTKVNVSIFDVSGRLVRTLVDGAMDKGEHSQSWDGADNGGHRVSGGIFWMKMQTENGYNSSMRIVVVPR